MTINESLLKRDEKAVFALRSLYSRFGYTQFKMSKFEEYDLYVKNKDFLISDNVITFTDTNGRLLALKPDVTLSIIKNSQDISGQVQKLYYNENVYRVSGSAKAYKEIMQTGLECIGDIDILEICEVLSLAVRSLVIIDDNCVLELSHVGLAEAAFDEIGVPETLHKTLIKCINRKNSDDLRVACHDNGIADSDAERLVAFTDSSKSTDDTFNFISTSFKSNAVKKALNEFQTIYNTLCAMGYSERIIVDFSAIGEMRYYSGVVFKGYINNIPEAVLSGGQYDKLMRKMHRKSGAIGFAVYLDTLQRFDNGDRQYDVDTILIYGDDVINALKTADELSSDGSSVMISRNVPNNLRFKKAVKLTEKGLETVHEND